MTTQEIIETNEVDLTLLELANEQTRDSRVSKILKKQHFRRAVRERVKGLATVLLTFGIAVLIPKDIDAGILFFPLVIGGYKLATGK